MTHAEWPAWRYGPQGEARVFNKESEVPAGWHDHPSKHKKSPEPAAKNSSPPKTPSSPKPAAKPAAKKAGRPPKPAAALDL